MDLILEVDGESIPMNDFVRKVLSGMITGSVKALHGVGDEWKTLNITIKR
ncbi:MAG: hypothetical protein PHH85_08410 [Candidatus Methanoperedens sp.]|nr:hypothetical protein [Candidatus Methanoperedens sp.]